MGDGQIRGVKICRNAPMISHLLFADDSLIYCNADGNNIRGISNILRQYEQLSGQKINFSKSEVVCSSAVGNDISTLLTERLGVKIVNQHSKYLGLPMVVSQNKTGTFKLIEEMVSSRIFNWKNKFLSRAGKEVLIKAVVQAIPNYAMQCFKLPLGLCRRLLAMAIRFWWSSKEDQKGIHWVSKDVLTNSKENGGLGFKCPEIFNKALVMKQAWRMLTYPDLLLSRIFKAKYFSSSSILYADIGARPSHAWRGIFETLEALKAGMEADPSTNAFRWKGSSSGLFTTRSAYTLLSNMEKESRSVSGETSDKSKVSNFWKKLWKAQVPNKVKHVVWRIYYDSLPVLENLVRRGVCDESECFSCGYRSEGSIHLFKKCWWSISLWNMLGVENSVYMFGDVNITDWIWLVVNGSDSRTLRVFFLGLWTIWHNRNLIAHGDRGWGVDHAALIVSAMMQQMDVFCSKGTLHRWPGLDGSDGVTKLEFFCDGAWSARDNKTGIAGVLVDGPRVVTIFADGLVVAPSSLDVEGLAIRGAMEITESLNIDNVLFLSDSMEAVKLIFGFRGGSVLAYSWIGGCQVLLSRMKKWMVKHICREQNTSADFLANKARRESWSWHSSDAIPLCLDFASRSPQ